MFVDSKLIFCGLYTGFKFKHHTTIQDNNIAGNSIINSSLTCLHIPKGEPAVKVNIQHFRKKVWGQVDCCKLQ